MHITFKEFVNRIAQTSIQEHSINLDTKEQASADISRVDDYEEDEENGRSYD